MNQIENEIAVQSGQPVEIVSQVLQSLRKVAIKRIGNGFTLPNFGTFSIVREPDTEGINPFTKEPLVFKGRRFVSFQIDSASEASFISGEDQTEPDAANDISEVRELPQIRLHPDIEQLVAAGLSKASTADANFKLGGHPDWIQGPNDVVCCHKRSIFYGQFDSNIGGDFNIGDAGMIYVFICDDCWTSRSIVQFY